MSPIFRPKNPTFLHQPFRELGTNWLFQMTAIAIGVLSMPSDRPRLPEYSVQENSENWQIFGSGQSQKKKKGREWVLDGCPCKSSVLKREISQNPAYLDPSRGLKGPKREKKTKKKNIFLHLRRIFLIQLPLYSSRIKQPEKMASKKILRLFTKINQRKVQN